MGFPGPGTAMAYASAIAMGASAYYASQNMTIAISLIIAGLVLAALTAWIEKIHTRKEVITCLINKTQDEAKIEKILKLY